MYYILLFLTISGPELFYSCLNFRVFKKNDSLTESCKYESKKIPQKLTINQKPPSPYSVTIPERNAKNPSHRV